MMFASSSIVDRIFQVFDKNEDDMISFSEYFSCISTISSNGTTESKTELSFKLYDFDGDGSISNIDLVTVLEAILPEHGLIFSHAQVLELVELTMKDISPSIPNKMSFEE